MLVRDFIHYTIFFNFKNEQRITDLTSERSSLFIYYELLLS